MDTSFYRIESYDGVEITVADCRGCSPEELVRRIAFVRDEIVGMPRNSVLMVTLAAGVGYSPDSVRALVAILRETRPYMRASAVVGLAHLTLFIRVLNHLSGRNIQAFEDIDDAKRWLRECADRERTD